MTERTNNVEVKGTIRHRMEQVYPGHWKCLDCDYDSGPTMQELKDEIERLRAWTPENPDLLTRIIAVLEEHGFHDEEWCDGPADLIQEVVAVCKLATGEAPEVTP